MRVSVEKLVLLFLQTRGDPVSEILLGGPESQGHGNQGDCEHTLTLLAHPLSKLRQSPLASVDPAIL